MNEDKATRYHRIRRRVASAAIVAAGLVLFALAATGADVALARAATAATRSLPAPDLLATVLLAVTLTAMVFAVRFPFDRYRESTLERRYGLERGSARAWRREHLRHAVVTALTVSLMALVVRACGAVSGALWWAPAALAWWAGHVLWTLSAPLVLTAFGGLRPLRRPALAARLRALGERAGAPLEVFEWRGGNDSRRAHAALAGVGRTRRVILSDTLLETLTEPEIEVVVAHELAHHLHADVWKAAASRLIALPLTSGSAALAIAWRFPGEAGVPLAALPVAALAGGAAHLVLQPLRLVLSRRQELAADACALRLTGDAEAFVSSMRRLSANNLIDDRPPALARLYASHPTVRERVLAVLRMAG
jgi:STE24 endopeptidase